LLSSVTKREGFINRSFAFNQNKIQITYKLALHGYATPLVV
jgi:hypothetical protein